MFNIGLEIVVWGSTLAVVSALAGLVSGFVGKWPFAPALSRASVFMAAALMPLSAIVLIYGFNAVANAGSSSEATALGEAISHGMNSPMTIALSLVIGIVGWTRARKRLRAAA